MPTAMAANTRGANGSILRHRSEARVREKEEIKGGKGVHMATRNLGALYVSIPIPRARVKSRETSSCGASGNRGAGQYPSPEDSSRPRLPRAISVGESVQLVIPKKLGD